MSLVLAEVMGQLRAELGTAIAEGEVADLRFELGSVGGELTGAVTKVAIPGARVAAGKGDHLRLRRIRRAMIGDPWHRLQG